MLFLGENFPISSLRQVDLDDKSGAELRRKKISSYRPKNTVYMYVDQIPAILCPIFA